MFGYSDVCLAGSNLCLSASCAARASQQQDWEPAFECQVFHGVTKIDMEIEMGTYLVVDVLPEGCQILSH